MVRTKNDAVMNEVEKSMPDEVVETMPEEEEMAEQEMERLSREAEKKAHEMVKIRLVFDRDHTEPVTVSVNGKTWMLKRGEEIEVPRFIKEVLDNSEKQDMVLYQMVQDQQEDLEVLNS